MKIKEQRTLLIDTLFPDDIPKLWCPPLTHYKADGSINFTRMKAHIKYMHPHINSYLIPGSTGDGWEITFDEYKALLSFVFEELSQELDLNILIGLLKTKTVEVKKLLEYTCDYLTHLGIDMSTSSSTVSPFKGFVICPPKGSDLTQEEISLALKTVLDFNYPTVLYQLPQITENEMSPHLIATLSATYDNFYMVKDSSGYDKIMLASNTYAYNNLVLLRGAEGEYIKYLGKHKYYGYLLSTGNSFPQQLNHMLKLFKSGSIDQANNVSSSVTHVVNEVFNLASTIKEGNIFTNSNKLIDHINAYGKAWDIHPSPLLHSGIQLSQTVLRKVESILLKYEMMPTKGYLI